jgi:hypothetical protein
VLERTPDRLRVLGHIYDIDQALHAFWLEILREGEDDRFAWFLGFDVAETSARRARRTLDTYDRAEEIPWRARLVGEATVNDALTVIPGSTRVLVQDLPSPDPPRGLRRRRRDRDSA